MHQPSAIGKHRALLCCLLIPLTLHAGTDPLQGYRIRDVDPASIQPAMNGRETWLQNDLRNYVYEIRMSCYCSIPTSVRVYVLDGRVVKIEDLDSGKAYTDAAMLSNYRTVPGLFDLIDDLMRRKPDRLHIRHHRGLGYPELIQADISYRMADDEVDYRISGLRLLSKQ